MTYLILAPTPLVRTWPFYGKAMQLVESHFALNPLPSWSEKTEQEHQEGLVRQHYRKVLDCLDQAKAALAKLEKDREAMLAAWPFLSEPEEEMTTPEG